MSNRNDIDKNNLIYTEELGWIDFGHAKGDDARLLWGELSLEEHSFYLDENYFIVEYKQSMGTKKIGAAFKSGIETKWLVKKGLSEQEKKSIALSIMFHTSLKFEKLQGSFPSNIVTDSGFSAEDLISNLLGFYSVVEPGKNYKVLAKPYSKEYSKKIWDYYGPVGKYKNEELKVIYFPDPSKSRNPVPIKKALPSWLSTIKPIDLENTDKVSKINIYGYHNFTLQNNYFNEFFRLKWKL